MIKQVLFSAAQVGSASLLNHIVMAPMTRCRATGNIPNELMAAYYEQRSSAGLIITEGTAPSPNGLGYARIPGIFNKEQTEGWKKITNAVHGNGGRIFLQLMHTGRISHPLNMPNGSEVIASSAVRAASKDVISNLQDFTGKLNTKGNSVNDLATDTVMYRNIRATLLQLQNASANVSLLTANLKTTSDKLNQKDNVAGTLLNDPEAGTSVKIALKNIETATKKLDENLEALQHNFLLRGFFRKKTKAEAKAKNNNSISAPNIPAN